MIFSYVMIHPARPIYPYGIEALGLPGFVWLLLYLIYSYIMGRKQMDNINHDAHLFGGLFGIVFTVLVIPGIASEFVDKIVNLRMF